MSYEEARRERRRARRNERVGLILGLLQGLGQSITSEIGRGRKIKADRDLELLRQDFEDKKQRRALQGDMDRAMLNRSTQLDVARTYASARERGGSSAAELEAMFDPNDPDLLANEAEIAKQYEGLDDADNALERLDRIRGLEKNRSVLRRRSTLRSQGRLGGPAQQTQSRQAAPAVDDSAMKRRDLMNERYQQLQGRPRSHPLPAQQTNDMESNPSTPQGMQMPGSNPNVTYSTLADAYQRFMRGDPAGWLLLQEFAGGSLDTPPWMQMGPPGYGSAPRQATPFGTTNQ